MLFFVLKFTTTIKNKKDHPFHDIFMLAGMWGMRVGENRELARNLFEIMVDPTMKSWYEYNNKKKDADQIFLEKFFRQIVESNVTAHDSFHCMKYGGKPFPKQRTSNYYCHVGGYGCCGPAFSNASFPFECPYACRPKFHKEWVFC